MSTRVDRLLAALVTTVIFAVYAATAARTVLGGDNGEFATIFAQGGVAHPSGYPLYTIYLRAMSWMPGASPAHAAALATSLIGVAAFGVMRVAARRWGASAPSATLAATVVALTPLAWKLATHAEVFALHALLAAAIVALAAPYARGSGVRRAFLLGLLAGFGLCNNHSIVTLAPLGLYAAWRAIAAARSRLYAVGAAVVGLGAGLLPYLWIHAFRAGPGPTLVWGEPGTWSGLLHHFLRADYGTVRLAISESRPNPVAHVGRVLGHLATETLVVPALVAVIGLVVLFRRPAPRASVPAVRPAASSVSSEAHPVPLHRRAVRATIDVPAAIPRIVASLAVPPAFAWVYAVTLVLAGPLFVARFNLPLEGLSLGIVERFYLLPLVLLVVPIALGLDRLLGARLAIPDVQGPVLIGVLCLFIFVGYEKVRDHHRPDVEYYLDNSLVTAEPSSVILGTGDHRLYGFWYMRHVLGRRPDVVYVDAAMLAYPWYVDQVEDELGLPLAGVDGRRVDTRVVALGLLRTGRPVYLANRFSDAITGALPTYPIGTLIRVLPPGTPSPSPERLEQMNVEHAVKYRYPDTDPRDPNGWAAHVQGAYTRPWQVLAETYEALGRPADAARCRSRVIILPQRTP